MAPESVLPKARKHLLLSDVTKQHLEKRMEKLTLGTRTSGATSICSLERYLQRQD